MAWNNNDDPWGNSNNKKGNDPQNIEDLLKKSKEQFEQKFKTPMNSPKVILLGVFILLGIWLLTGFYKVSPGEQAVVLRFGESIDVTKPGLHYHLPAPIERVEILKVEELKNLTVGTAVSNQRFRSFNKSSKNFRASESYMLTGDENIIDIIFSVQWKISNPEHFLFNVRNPEGTILKVAEASMRDVIANTPIQPALNELRQQIQQDTKVLIQNTLNMFEAGIEIVEVQLQKVDPPEEVIDAFRDVQRARADMQRLKSEAETYRNSIIPVAKGEAVRITQEAEAYKQKIITEAQGQARRFLDVYEGYVIDRQLYTQRLYLETMENILSDRQMVIIDSEDKGQSVLPFLPLPGIKQKPAGDK